MKYVYPAIFTKESVGFSIVFPDLESCYTQGDDLQDGIQMAEDVLAITLFRMERESLSIPEPSDMKSFSLANEEFATLIKCDTLIYRKKNSSKAVKKTLTIPEWLNDEALSMELNFSQILQDALVAVLQRGHRAL